MSLSVFPSLPGLTYTSMKTPKFNTLVQSGANEYEVRLPQYTNPVWTWTLIFDFLHDFFWGSFETVSELRTLMGFVNDNYGKASSFLYTDPDDNSVGPALVGGLPNVPLAQLALVSDGVGNYYSPVQRTLDGTSFEDITDLNGAIAVYLDGTLAAAGSGVNQYTLEGPGLAIPGHSWMGMVLKWGPGAPAWAAGHAYLMNDVILDPAGHIQKVTTAGTSGSTAPVFNDAGGSTPDGTGTLVWIDENYYSGPPAPVTAQFRFYFRVRFESDSQDFEKFLGAGSSAGAPPAGQGGGYWTIGGENSQNGSGTLVLRTARPVPL
jgi:hypothetical protein